MATYLVTGATGHQGGAVVDHLLLRAGTKVHAVVRDPTSPKATALQAKGVILFKGTFGSPTPAFALAAAGCTGLFLNLSVFDPTIAQSQAAAILSTCRAGAGETLTTVVLSSTSRTNKLASDPSFAAALTAIDPMLTHYYRAKAGVEAAVRASGLAHHTIIRPGVLHHNYLLPTSASQLPTLPRHGELLTTLDPDATMPHCSPDDVGRLAAAALLEGLNDTHHHHHHRHRFSGHEFDLASENLGARDVAAVLGRVAHVPVTARRRTEDEIRDTDPGLGTPKFEKLCNALPSVVHPGVVEERYGVKLETLEGYMRRHREELVASLPPVVEGRV